tara:strand:- start:486 stop:1364 length:879 start_codon:yes stop_codon:yes gene_type:complete
MLRIGLLIFFFLSVSNLISSQEKFEYVGGLKLNDTTIVSFKISFVEKAGEVRGFSVTDIGGEHETMSNIFGEYNKDDKELSFREIGIVYTKSPVSQEDFCFLNVTAKNFVFGKTKSIKTKFVGLFSDNTRCIDGEVILNTIEKVEKRISKVTDKISRSKKIPDSIKQKLNVVKMMDSLQMNILRKNETLSYFTKSKKIRFIIYDGGQDDGDKINIIVNGKTLLKSYKANSSEKYLDIELATYKTSVVVEAINEGTIAPNTVVVKIDDGKNIIRALSNLKTLERTQIDILKSN